MLFRGPPALLAGHPPVVLCAIRLQRLLGLDECDVKHYPFLHFLSLHLCDGSAAAGRGASSCLVYLSVLQRQADIEPDVDGINKVQHPQQQLAMLCLIQHEGRGAHLAHVRSIFFY